MQGKKLIVFRTAVPFALRLTVAALLAYWLARQLEVHLPLWVVLTAMIVTQTSLGRSLKVTLDYVAGTLLGALWSGLVMLLVPHSTEPGLFAALALVLMPLALVSAIEPRSAAAPLTAAIVFLMPHMTPMSSVAERLIEVGLGGLVGLVVSLLIFPSSAFQHVRYKAADVLDRMAEAVNGLMTGQEKGIDTAKARELQLSIGPLLAGLEDLAGEAARERSLKLSSEESGPLLRSLLRLRHDLVIIGRSAHKPLPVALAATTAASYRDAGQALFAHFKASADALRSQRTAPHPGTVDTAIARYTADIEAARHAGKLGELSGDEIEHLFAMGFGLDQLRRNLSDLNRCISAWSN